MLEQALGRAHVVAQVLLEALAEGSADPRLRRQVEDHVDALEQALERLAGEVELHHRETRLLHQELQVALLRRSRVVRREAVDAEHLAPLRNEPLRKLRAEESGAARDEVAPAGHRRRAAHRSSDRAETRAARRKRALARRT